MKYWLDTEFIEDGQRQTIDLISIGLVAEDNRSYYACNEDCDLRKANEWVKENVIPLLPSKNINFSDPSLSPSLKQEALLWKPKKQITLDVLNFCDPGQYGEPEFWGYYADYDWVVFCWLFGSMIDLPKGYPFFCRDIKQLHEEVGCPPLPDTTNEHNALEDAKWNKDCWYLLDEIRTQNSHRLVSR